MLICRVAAVSAALVLVGCSTSPIRTSGYNKSAEGIPYHLPTNVQRVDIEVIRDGKAFQDLNISVTPILVPDRSKLFYLNSANHSTFSIDHKISIKNGMLTTVNTVDDGQIGELALSVVDSASAVARGLVSAQSAETDAFQNDNEEITNEEIEATLGMIRGDKFSFSYGGLSSTYPLPGSGNMLII